jgi:membrane protein DedA with SNARE-associated domain
MGYYGGKPVVLKIGKYLLLNPHDLERTEQFFHRRSGLTTIFIARFVPVVRHFISIPAGMGRTPMIPFLIVTFIGSTAWNTFLLGCGMKLREHWTTVQKYSHLADYVIVGCMLIGVIWWVKVRWPQFRAARRSGLAPKEGGVPPA